MSFASPLAFYFLLLTIPVIVLYILKVRLRREPVSTNMFWSQIYDEKPPRSIWRYLKHLLSLLLQLLFLLLLVAAIADPYFLWQLKQSRRVVLVVDNSASMQAMEKDGNSRFDLAIEKGLDLVEGLRERDEMAIIVAEARPRVAIGMSGHAPTLRRTLQALQVSDQPTTVTPAVDLGRQLIGEHPHGEVVVLTDGCLPGSTFETVETPPTKSPGSEAPETNDSETTPDRETTLRNRYLVVGSPQSNVGITQLQLRRSLVDPTGYEVLVKVLNASDRPVDCRLELELNGSPVDVLPLELEPNEEWTRSLEKTSVEGGELTAMLTQIKASDVEEESTSVSTDDARTPKTLNGLKIDDRAWAILPPKKIQKVLIVTSGNLFLQKVFEANPLVDVTLMNHFPDPWPRDSLIVLHGEVPETLPEGDLFVIDPATDCDLWSIGPVLENPIVTELNAESRLMTHVRLDNVLVPKAEKIDFHTEATPLASTISGDLIYARLTNGAGRLLVLNVDLEESDLAFRTTFPIMVTNALGWYAGQTGDLNLALRTGEITNVSFERDQLKGNELKLFGPDGSIQEIPLLDAKQENSDSNRPIAEEGSSPSAGNDRESNSVTLGPFARAGVWKLEVDPQNPLAEYAVNLSNAEESDLRPAEELGSQEPLQSLAGFFTRPLWFYLALAASLLFLIEWFLYQRRIIA
ncbi:MAG: BatA domain-containing protein [Planctomycetaceae bacterium]|nr:BatA domain-containing protein [Planctomycetaceae bacterium]